MPNIPAKKDYVEIIALLEHGGVFMDVDFTCLQPLDELVYRYSYF